MKPQRAGSTNMRHISPFLKDMHVKVETLILYPHLHFVKSIPGIPGHIFFATLHSRKSLIMLVLPIPRTPSHRTPDCARAFQLHNPPRKPVPVDDHHNKTWHVISFNVACFTMISWRCRFQCISSHQKKLHLQHAKLFHTARAFASFASP